MGRYQTLMAFLVTLFFSGHAFAAELQFLMTERGNVPVYVPDDYSPDEPLPLVMALHGITGTSDSIEGYFDFQLQVDLYRFIYVIPQGTTNLVGQTFWNATDACCDLFGSDVDDSGYLRALIEQAQSVYSIEANRIHIVGYSNGGFMAHRMAIDHADILASIVSLAGANYEDADDHSPVAPLHTLQIHGTNDGTVSYDGGLIFFTPYPGAIETQSNWATYNGLSDSIIDVGVSFDLDSDVSGDEATIKMFGPDNIEGIDVELWTLTGSGHGPDFGDGLNNRFAERVLSWVYDHPRPTQTVVVADTVEVVQGESVVGGVDELEESDNADWVVQRRFNSLQPRVVVELSIQSPVAEPHSIQIQLESAVFARPLIEQTIELFDHVNEQWETVSVTDSSRFVDSTVEITLSGEVSRFVDPVSRELPIRVSHESTISRARFSAHFDYLMCRFYY